MGKKVVMSKSNIKKLNKFYKMARERVHHCDLKRLNPASFCLESDPEFADVCDALQNCDRGKISEIFLLLNQQKREQLYNGELTESEYTKWCDGIRMIS